ncbi:MAG: hypothetical protein RJA70_4933 [Pseudomonadota bacterium]
MRRLQNMRPARDTFIALLCGSFLVTCAGPDLRVCGWNDARCRSAFIPRCDDEDWFRPHPVLQSYPVHELPAPDEPLACSMVVQGSRSLPFAIFVTASDSPTVHVREIGKDGPGRTWQAPVDWRLSSRLARLCSHMTTQGTRCLPRLGHDGTYHYLTAYGSGKPVTGFAWSPRPRSGTGLLVETLLELAAVATSQSPSLAGELHSSALNRVEALDCLMGLVPSEGPDSDSRCERILSDYAW